MTARENAQAALANVEQSRDIHMGRFDGAVGWDPYAALTQALERAESALRDLLDEVTPEPDWEWAVRQHDGHVWEQDLDDEPWTREQAYEDQSEIEGGHVVRRRSAGPWEPAPEESQ